MERVPELKRSGALWVACCPFHEEKTPSFKVDPRRGSWHCYGACSKGGDVLSFVMEFDRVGFGDALEILAAKTGVELERDPVRSAQAKRDRDETAELYRVLERAEQFFRRQLDSAEGEATRRYLTERGLHAEVLQQFGIGYAPASGRVLVDEARRSAVDPELLIATGLMRRTDAGRPYDFFRGRMTIPIRDERGRTVGFGARRLGDSDESGPKYVNTPETRLFHKGRLIYGLDLSMTEARRTGELTLVEGYTDVMAAHQAGLTTVGAVLGTSTTEDHAALVRRAGVRRVNLVFDGDEAGRKAALRALHGLLPLDVDLRLASLPQGSDPCDRLTRADGGSYEAARASFREFLDAAPNWFDALADELVELHGLELSRGVDQLLELFLRIQKPVRREDRKNALAARLNISPESLDQQWRELPARRRAEHRERDPRARAATPRSSGEEPGDPRAAEGQETRPPEKTPLQDRLAFGGLLGAVLLDTSLVPLLRVYREPCPVPELAPILEAILALDDREVEEIDEDHVMTELLDHPLRASVTRIVEYARRAESPKALFDDGNAHFERRRLEAEWRDLSERVAHFERLQREAADPEDEERANHELKELRNRMDELSRARLRRA